jgi:very-short-patch-repair endonuclease
MRIDSIRILRLAERQWGLITRAQLTRSGIGDATITGWTRTGRLQRIYPRVYAVGHRVLTTEGRLAAALLYAGPGAALSHATATGWWELLPYLPNTIDVCSPERRRPLPGLRIHRAARIERIRHRGLPVTPVARTLLDFAAVASLERVRQALAEADFQRLLDLEAVDAELGRGRSGSARLREALVRHRPQYAQTRTVLEDRLLDLCAGRGIPLPQVNTKVLGFEVDAVWHEQRVVVEVDGGPAHGSIARVHEDRERDLALRTAGFVVLRYTWRQLTTQPDLVAADLIRALAVTA